ncbi:MAG: hypothetical protein WD076_05055 [Parvularculaceae bacterium]
MWEQIRRVIFDASEATGLGSGFLANLVAESVGVFFGVIISVLFAIWLDQGREAQRHADHRRRAVTRWVRNQSDMLDDVVAEGGRASEDEKEARLQRRMAVVADAILDANYIWSDYEDAFKKRKMRTAFEDYLHALSDFKGAAGKVLNWVESVAAPAQSTVVKLDALIKIVGERREARRMAPILKDMLKRARPNGVDDPPKATGTLAAFTGRVLSRSA